MITINLLPWREELRAARKQRALIAFACCVVVSLCVMLLVHSTFISQIRAQDSRNNYLKSEINTLNIKLRQIQSLRKDKATLLGRMNIIQRLQADRPRVVHLFDELVNILPKNIYLTSIQRKNDIVTITGKSETNTNISQLLRNIARSAWLTQPMLNIIKTKSIEGKKNYDFTLQLSLVSQKNSTLNR